MGTYLHKHAKNGARSTFPRPPTVSEEMPAKEWYSQQKEFYARHWSTKKLTKIGMFTSPKSRVS